jgi:hypothetical protein
MAHGLDVGGEGLVALADARSLARRVLEPERDPIALEDARGLLVEAEQLLGSMTADPDMPVKAYACVADLRDRVGSHLSAALSLQEVGREEIALDLLDRAARLVIEVPVPVT